MSGADQVREAEGSVLGNSPWRPVPQSLIDGFADLTGDHQWIHVDTERAAEGPFGRTIAHGYLTLAMVPSLAKQVFAIHGTRMIVNYGLNRVRFVSPVLSEARVRLMSTLARVNDVDGGLQLTFEHVLQIEGQDKPACVCEALSRCYF